MRLPYIPDDPQMASVEDQAVVDRVKERRGGKLIPLDKALLQYGTPKTTVYLFLRKKEKLISNLLIAHRMLLSSFPCLFF